MLNKILQNHIFLFSVNKYFIFVVQFFNFSFISIKLGPLGFGIYSFIFLVVSYLNYTSLGVEYSLNVILSTKKNKFLHRKVFSSGFLILFITSVLLISLSVSLFIFDFDIYTKYSFKEYLIPAVVIAIFWNFNNYYSNLYRVYGKLFEIAFFQTITQLIIVPILIFYKNENLIDILIYGIMISHIASFLFFLFRSPIKFSFEFKNTVTSIVFKRGLLLLFYNLTHVLMLLSLKTIVSLLYSVDDMGKYSFAHGISQTAVMGLSVITFILFPKLINKLNFENFSMSLFNRVFHRYFSAIYLIIITIIIFLPLFLSIFDDYSDSKNAIIFLLLSQIIVGCSFTHTVLLISNKNEIKLGMIALISVIFNIIFSFVVHNYLDLEYHFIAFVNIISALIYSYLVIRLGNKVVKKQFKLVSPKINFLVIIPFILILINTLNSDLLIINIMSLLIFIILDRDNMKKLFNDIIYIFTDLKL